MPLDVQLNKYTQIKLHAESRNESVNGFIKRVIDETMQREHKWNMWKIQQNNHCSLNNTSRKPHT